jgi:DNA-binding NarL/FixJ family response regulator
VLSLLYDGKTNKAIAFITGISEKTVEKHRARIMLKLNVNSTAELIRLVCYAERIHKPQTNDNDLSAENS